ncbi:MAG: hypothetical protein ACOYMN_10860, partial [Roseimicrobium sp.]
MKIFVGSGLNEGQRIANLAEGGHLILSEFFFNACMEHDPALVRDRVFPHYAEKGSVVFPHRYDAGTV